MTKTEIIANSSVRLLHSGGRKACNILHDAEFSEPQSGEKGKQQSRRPTDNCVLYHDYSRDVHEWLTDFRRVHCNKRQATINGKVVKVTNLLVQQGESLYYVHSKTAYPNSFFFEFCDESFVKTFGLLCP